MLKLLGKCFKPYWKKVIAVLLFVLMQVACELALPTITAGMIDIGFARHDMSYITTHGIQMITVSLCQVGSMIGVGYLSSVVSASMSRDLRQEIFKKAETFSLNEMNRIGVSSLIVRTTNDVNMIRNFSVMLMRMVLVAPAMLVGSIILTLRVNRELAKVVFVSVPLLITLFATIIILATKYFALQQKRLDHLNLLLREHLGGTRVIRAFVNQKTEQDKFEIGNDDVYRISLKIHRITSSMMPAMMLIINVTSVAVSWFGVIQISKGGMQLGELVSFIQYVMQILISLSMLSMLMIVLPRANICAKRINEVLNTVSCIADPKEPKKPAPTDSNGTIKFTNVSFTYPGGDAPVLSNINFTAESGKTTAIVGSTGSGKTTLLNLIPRLYDASQGSITLDGIDIRDYELENLRDKIGYVPQKAVLFSGTIADNVRFGCRHATDEEVSKALEISQSLEFVRLKPNGVNEEVSQGGKNVSGGQKQRLAIARAIVRRCEAYIFDDSFSALDYATDSRLRQALAKDNYIGKFTKIIVAQRVSTVMNADKIIVLDNGKIVGEGTHGQLLENCKLYYEIASSQLSEEELK